MTKRIYKADNPQDVKELFQFLDRLFPTMHVVKIFDFGNKFDCKFSNGCVFSMWRSDNADWDIKFIKPVITRPVEIKVGQFGKFWDKNSNFVTYSILKDITEEKEYVNSSDCDWGCFAPIAADSDEGKAIIKAMGGGDE